MDSDTTLYMKRAIVPSLISTGILVSIGIATRRNVGVILLLGFVGLPIGYVIGNAGKW